MDNHSNKSFFTFWIFFCCGALKKKRNVCSSEIGSSFHWLKIGHRWQCENLLNFACQCAKTWNFLKISWKWSLVLVLQNKYCQNDIRQLECRFEFISHAGTYRITRFSKYWYVDSRKHLRSILIGVSQPVGRGPLVSFGQLLTLKGL